MRDALTIAGELIGKILVRRLNTGEELRFRITETEAYCGEEDTACHAHKGKTPRNAVMYRSGGCAYVYLCYGIHYLLNIVTGKEGRPEAVLIRGAESLNDTHHAKNLNGPGKLTKAAFIDKSLNGTDVTGGDELWLEDDGYPALFIQTKRIGIDYATEEYREKLWRFIQPEPHNSTCN